MVPIDTDVITAGSPHKIVVVGPCASGKSTLVAGLRRHGFDAMVSGQEHSDIPSLWRHPDPDVVIALAVDLATIRQRRADRNWPEWLYQRQLHRLQQAMAVAGIRIDTSHHSAESVLRQAISGLHRLIGNERRPPSRS